MNYVLGNHIKVWVTRAIWDSILKFSHAIFDQWFKSQQQITLINTTKFSYLTPVTHGLGDWWAQSGSPSDILAFLHLSHASFCWAQGQGRQYYFLHALKSRGFVVSSITFFSENIQRRGDLTFFSPFVLTFVCLCFVCLLLNLSVCAASVCRTAAVPKVIYPQYFIVMSSYSYQIIEFKKGEKLEKFKIYLGVGLTI